MTYVRLLVVEQTFHLASPDRLLVAPTLDVSHARPDDVPLTLRFPDGRKRDVVGRIETTHFQRPMTARAPSFVATVVLPGLAPEDVPPGTEVWAPEAPSATAIA